MSNAPCSNTYIYKSSIYIEKLPTNNNNKSISIMIIFFIKIVIRQNPLVRNYLHKFYLYCSPSSCSVRWCESATRPIVLCNADTTTQHWPARCVPIEQLRAVVMVAVAAMGWPTDSTNSPAQSSIADDDRFGCCCAWWIPSLMMK